MTAPDIELAPSRRLARRRGVKPLIERRFPLHLQPALHTVRDLYNQSKSKRWDPDKHIPWDKFESSAYDLPTRKAAALSWSRRAWAEFSGIAETPAILIRFCLEHEGESDPKMFLTVRGTEESWHMECAYRFAQLLERYIDNPPDEHFHRVMNIGLFRQAFDPALLPVAYIAAHIALLDGIDLELHRGYLRHAQDPVAVSILKRMVEDKERHTAFGWIYLEQQISSLDKAIREEIQAEVEHILRVLVLGGYQSAAFAPPESVAHVLDADALTRAAGLGAMLPQEEVGVVRQYVAEARARFGSLGIDLALVRHDVHGDI